MSCTLELGPALARALSASVVTIDAARITLDKASYRPHRRSARGVPASTAGAKPGNGARQRPSFSDVAGGGSGWSITRRSGA